MEQKVQKQKKIYNIASKLINFLVKFAKMMNAKSCGTCRSKDGALHKCNHCGDIKYFCFTCKSLCRKCYKHYEIIDKVQSRPVQDNGKKNIIYTQDSRHRRGLGLTTSTTENHIIRNLKSVDPGVHKKTTQNFTQGSKGSYSRNMIQMTELESMAVGKFDNPRMRYEQQNKKDRLVERQHQREQKPITQNHFRKGENIVNGLATKQRLKIGQSNSNYYRQKIQQRKIQIAQSNNYMKNAKESEKLTGQKQLQQVKRWIPINKGYKHNGCQIVHKLYELTKLIEQARKKNEQRKSLDLYGDKRPCIILPGCNSKLQISCIQQMLKDRCLQCGKQGMVKHTMKYELKNGCFVCSFACMRVKHPDKELAQYYSSLFYYCMGCRIDPKVKTKKSDMQMQPGQDPWQLVCCIKCFIQTRAKQNVFKKMSEIEKNNQPINLDKAKKKINYLEQQQEKPNHEFNILESKSHIRHAQPTVFNYRKQQSLPKKINEKTANIYSYKPSILNSYEEDYGLKNFREKVFQKNKKQYQCIICQNKTVSPVFVDQMVICAVCDLQNKQLEQQKEEKKRIYRNQEEKIQTIKNFQNVSNNSLNKKLYDQKRHENQVKVILEEQEHQPQLKQSTGKNQTKPQLHSQQKDENKKPQYLKNQQKNVLQKDAFVKQSNSTKITQSRFNQNASSSKQGINALNMDINRQASRRHFDSQTWQVEDSRHSSNYKTGKDKQAENKVAPIYECVVCQKKITELKDVGIVTENQLAFCRECKNDQKEALENVPIQNKTPYLKSSEYTRGTPQYDSKKYSPHGGYSRASNEHKPSVKNSFTPKSQQLSDKKEIVMDKQLKPSPEKSKLSSSNSNYKTFQKPSLSINKPIDQSSAQNLNISQSFERQSEPYFKIQSIAHKEQSPIKTQKPKEKEEKKPTILQQMKRKLRGQGSIRQDDEQKVEKNNTSKVENSNHSKIEKSNPQKLQTSNPSRIQNSVQINNQYAKNLCQNSRIKSSASSRKSFQLPENPNIMRPRVQYSDILTQSMLQDEPTSQSFSHPESPQKRERSLEEHSMSLRYDPKEQEMKDQLIPTNDQQEEKLFRMTENGAKKPPSKIKRVDDPRLTSTEFEAFRTIVDELSSSEEKSYNRKDNLFVKQKQPQDEYVKQSFNELSEEKPIKNEKLQVKLEDMQKPSKSKLLNCSICQLMLQLSKGFMINENNELLTEVTPTNAPRTFMCQQCYYGQYFGQKQALDQVRKSRLEVEREKNSSGQRKFGFKSLRQEEDAKKRNRSTAKTPMHEVKVSAQKQRATTPLTPSQSYGFSGVSTPQPESKTYTQRVTTPSSLYSQSGTYGASVTQKSAQVNLNQKSFLQQKLAKNQRKTQAPYSEVQRISQISESSSRDAYKSDIAGDIVIGKKKYMCKRCKHDVTILCFDEYCVECFKNDE